MIAVDANILIYAHRGDSPHHLVAAQCMTTLATGLGSWAIPWPCLHEFFAIVTQRIYLPPSTTQEAINQIEIWLESPGLVMLAESGRHWSELREMIVAGHVAGPRVHDARIAAICRQHGVRELWSADRDFSRFANLKTVNPLL